MAEGGSRPVEVSIRVRTGTSAEDLARVVAATTALNKALTETEPAGKRAAVGIKEIAAGTFLGHEAAKLLERGFDLVGEATRKFLEIGREAIKQAAAEEETYARLGATLRATGQYSQAYIAELDELGRAQARASTFTVAQVAEAQNQLLTFGASREEIRKLLPAVIDLATAQKQDLQTAAFNVGKALDGQTTALKKAGVAIDENTAANKRAGVIADQIEKKYSGQGAAAAGTYSGAVKQLTASYEDLLVAGGELVTKNDAVVGILQGVREAFELATEFIKENRVELQEFITDGLLTLLDTAPLVVDALGLIARAFGELMERVAGAKLVAATDLQAELQRVVDEGRSAYDAAKASRSPIDADALKPNIPSYRLAELGLPDNASLEDVEKLLGTTKERVADLGAEMGKATSRTEALDRATADLRKRVSDLGTTSRAKVEGDRELSTQLRAQAQAAVANGTSLQVVAAAVAKAREEGHKLSPDLIELASRMHTLGDESEYTGGRTHAASKADEKRANALANLRKDLEATIIATEAEIRIRQEGIARGEDVAATEARIGVAKQLAKAQAEGLIGAVGAEAKQLEELAVKAALAAEESQRLGQAQQLLKDLQRENTGLAEQLEMLEDLRARGESVLEVQVRMAGAKAAEGVTDRDLADRLRKEAELRERTAQATDRQTTAIKQLDDARKNVAALETEVQLLEQVRAGTLALKQAEEELAVDRARRANNGDLDPQTEAAIRQQSQLEQRVKRLREVVKDDTIQLGDEITNVFAKVAEGIALGTNKGLSAMDALKQGGKAIFAQMLTGMLKDKLGFDLEFKTNFLRDLPNIVTQAVGLISGIFGGGMQQMGGSVSGLFSGGPGSTANQWATLLAGNGGGGGGGGGGGLLTTGGLAFKGLSLLDSLDFTSFGAFTDSLPGAIGNVTGLSDTLGTLTSGLSTFGVTLGETGTMLGLLGQGANAATALAAFAVDASPVLSAVATTLSTTLSWIPVIGWALAAATGAYTVASQTAQIRGNVQSGAFGLGDLREVSGPNAGGFLRKAVTDAVGGGPGFGERNYAASQRVLGGHDAGAEDWARTIWTALVNLPELISAAFASSLPTKGTATRVQFESLLENKDRKHESRRYAPYFGNVPVLQDGEYVTGSFDRGIGQEGTRDILRQRYGTDKNTPDGAFVDAMREYIELQRVSLGLSEDQLKQFIGLGVAFRAGLGGKAGSEETRSIATIADMLGSLVKSGASVATAMGLVRIELAKLGDPARVFKKLNDFFLSPENDIAVEDYRAAIEGLAAAYFKLDSEKNLTVDLSDKNQKGLDVAKEYRDAFDQIIQSVPPGVKVIEIAVGLLDKAIDATGKQGVVSFEDLKEAIDAAVASAQRVNPEVLKFAQTVGAGAAEAIKNGTQDQLVTSAQEQFVQTLGAAIYDTVTQALTNAFIDAQLNTGLLGPLQLRVNDAIDKFNGSAKGPDDLAAFNAEVKDAGLDAIAAVKELAPGLRELGRTMLDVSKAVHDALTSTSDDVAGLATAIAQLETAQRVFNEGIDLRIAALRGGSTTPAALRAQLPAIEAEGRATIDEFFGPDTASKHYTTAERSVALESLRDLTERYLAIQIQAIEAELAAKVAAHQLTIKHLQDEREHIQDVAAAAIEAKQAELETVEEQLEVAEKWRDVVDQTRDTILAIRTGQDSPESPVVRLQLAQAAFEAQRRRLRDTSLSVDDRTDAAGQLNTLGPQVLGLLSGAGFAQSSEQYRAIYRQVLQGLDEATATGVANGANTAEDLQKRQTQLTADIKALEKDQAAQLKAIDAQIKAEGDAIEAAQNEAKAAVDRVNLNAAGVLEYIKGQQNNLFAERHKELAEKLAALGVTDISLDSIAASSLTELQRIRELIEGQGSTVTRYEPGKFGITRTSQQQIRGNAVAGNYDLGTLSVIQNAPALATLNNFAPGSSPAQYVALMRQVFPGAQTIEDFREIAAALRDKQLHPEQFNDVLGFATGGLVRRETIARVGEGGAAELILPLSRALQEADVQRTLERLAGYNRLERSFTSVQRQLALFARAQQANTTAIATTRLPPAVATPTRPAPEAARAAQVIIQKLVLPLQLEIDHVDATSPDAAKSDMRRAVYELIEEALRTNKFGALVAEISRDRNVGAARR